MFMWEVVTNPSYWYISSSGFVPRVGNRFWVDCLPLLGTQYSGLHEGEVTAVEPELLLELAVRTYAGRGQHQHWNVKCKLISHGSGTLVEAVVGGLDTRRREHRILLRVVEKIVELSLPRHHGDFPG